MLSSEEAKQVIHACPDLNSLDQLMVLLAVDTVRPLKVQEIKQRAAAIGATSLTKKNVSDILAKSKKGLVARLPTGWELLEKGRSAVLRLTESARISPVIVRTNQALRDQVLKLPNELTRAFVDEAIGCFEARHYRAAVIMVWSGAIALLQDHVYRNKLRDFNLEAERRFANWKTAKQKDDFGRMKEHDFLDVCEAIGILGKNVKQILQNKCLALRNGCGHPNSLAIGENTVAAHIELLVDNVFARF